MKFTFWDNTSRWTLSFPNFYFVTGVLGEDDGVFWSDFFMFTWNRLPGKESWDTQPNCAGSFNNATVPFASPFFDLLLVFPSASKFGKTFSSIHAYGLRLAVLTHGRMSEVTWRFFTEFESARSFAPLVWRAFLSVAWCFLKMFSSFVCLGLRIWCGRRRSSITSLTTVQVSLY